MKKSWQQRQMEKVVKNKPKGMSPQSGRKLDLMWKTAEGKLMTIDQMDDGHLLNSIRLLERRANSILGAAIMPESGDAVTAAERAMKMFPVYPEMVRVLEARLAKKQTTPVVRVSDCKRKFNFEE